MAHDAKTISLTIVYPRILTKGQVYEHEGI